MGRLRAKWQKVDGKRAQWEKGEMVRVKWEREK
jgi:hypothetical protein